MSNTKEKIENGTIRIENGRLVGIGFENKESIDLNFLDELMEFGGKKYLADALDRAAVGIGRVGLYFYNCNIDASKIIDDIMISMLPNEGELWALGEISQIFKS